MDTTYALGPSLMAIYHLTQHVQFDHPLPAELQWRNFRLVPAVRMGVHEWTLELIARELILNAPPVARQAMDNWTAYATVFNQVRHIENEVWGRLPNGEDLIQYELIRIAHRQFPWQVKPNRRLIASYLRLYRNPRLTGLMQATFGMTAEELFQIGLSVAGGLLSRPIIQLPLDNRLNRVPAATLNQFVERFAIRLDPLRQQMRAAQSYDVNWAYVFDPLRRAPLIRLQNSLLCPMPTLFLWRITDGLYFDLVQQSEAFNANFGLAFQDLAGDVVRNASNGGQLQALPEQRYGTRQRPRDSVDLIVQDETGIMFVECKASRLRAQAKADIVNTAMIDAELDRLAGFVAQLYRTLHDAEQGLYSHWLPDERPVFPVLLTLDEWLPSGQLLDDRVTRTVRERLIEGGLDPALVDRRPFTLCSLYEFEALAKIISVEGVAPVMGGKTAEQARYWAVMPYLQDRFRAVFNRTALFEDEWDRLLDLVGLGAAGAG